MARFLCLLLVLVCQAVCCASQSQRRNLSEVRYHYTPCGASGRNGPNFAQCAQYYSDVGSPISKHGVHFDFEDGVYKGAQGFRVLRSGVFNVTIAAGRGGKGLCSFAEGRPIVRKVRVEMSTEFELLVLVGQKGVSVCDASPNFFLCATPQLAFPDTTANCRAMWEAWLYNMSLSGLHAGEADNVYAAFGGAGGGGASLVRARNVTSGELDRFPIAIAGRSGGSAAILNFTIVDDLNIEISHVHSIEYFQLLDGKARENDNTLGGVRGSRDGSSNSVAGAGGGNGVFFRLIDVDGGTLSAEENFALGGTDCSQHFGSVIRIPFAGTFGGFGGGGGGCGGGGGGGGFTGGAVLLDDNQVPGGGGFSYLGTSALTSFDPVFIADILDDDTDDGYVDIIRVDCGCVHNCTVFVDSDEFECNCPADTSLAPDLNDCFYASEIVVSEGPFIEDHIGAPFSIVTFENYSYIFGVEAELDARTNRQSDSGGSDDKCALLFFGENSNIVLTSNAVSGYGTIDKLAAVNVTTGGLRSISAFTSFLTSSVLVTGAVLVGTANCAIQNMLIQVNSSIQPVGPVAPLSTVDAEVIALVADVVLERPEVDRVLSSGAIVGIVIGCVVAAVIVVLVIAVVSGYGAKRRKNRNSENISTKDHTANDSLVRNNAYFKHTVQVEEDGSMQDHRYELLEYEREAPGGSDIRRVNSFKPVHGITAPAHDFSEFNKQRSLISVKDWEYPRSRLIYMRELGEGEFGKVLLMKAEAIAGYEGSIPVAVKTLTSKDPQVIEKFTEEAELMGKFSHPNIVSLLGFSDQIAGEDSAPLMILEYMPFGDLQKFLVSHRPSTERRSLITKEHFYCFACDIAKGLDFLSSMMYIHRDIAARNCLVGANLQIKIADFGLARVLLNKDYYKLAGKAVLPVRWMAPESILFGLYTSVSDVWSYGVLLWEIVTYGEMPLEDMGLNDIVKAATNKTLRLERPRSCPDDLYNLMCRCHTHEAEERPPFSVILAALSKEGDTASVHSQTADSEGSAAV